MQCMGFPAMLGTYAFFAEKTYVIVIQQNVDLNVSACSNTYSLFVMIYPFFLDVVWLVQLMITL